MEPDARLPLSPGPYLWLAGTSLLVALALGGLLVGRLGHPHRHLGGRRLLDPLVGATAAR